MPGTTTGEKMATNMQHLEGQQAATGRANSEAKNPVPKQPFPATLRLAEHVPVVCCACRLTQMVLFHLLVLLDVGAAPFQTDRSYFFPPVFTALPSAAGTELHCQLYQG